MAGAVARVYERWQNPMLVLEAPQEAGKSYFVRWLCPLDGLYYAGPISPSEKDCQLRRATTWLWEVEELGFTTRKQDVNALKSFLTLASVQERRPYGHYDVTKPAMASFVGTTNDADFLTDKTGNRRFLTAPILAIDWAYSTEIDRDQLWAQAQESYRAGGWKLSATDRAERDEQNAAHMIDDPVEVRLESLLTFTGRPQDFVATDAIQHELRQSGFAMGTAMSRAIAATLGGWGAVSARRQRAGKQERGYTCITFT